MAFLTEDIPSNLILQNIQNQVKLTWQDNTLISTGFKVYRNSTLITTIPKNSTIVYNGIDSSSAKSVNTNMTNVGVLGSGNLWSYSLDKTQWSTLDTISATNGTTPSINITGMGVPEVVVSLNDIDLSDISTIQSIAWNSTLENGGIALIMASVDSGATYKAWGVSDWVNVDINNIDSIKSLANTQTVFNALTNTQIASLVGSSTKIRFAYYINFNNTNDAKLNNHTIVLNCKNASNQDIVKTSLYNSGTGNAVSYTDNTPISGSTNVYEVSAYDITNGESGKATNSIITIPSIPLNLRYTVSGFNITFNWDSTSCDGYKVYDGNDSLITTTTNTYYTFTNSTEQSKSLKVSAYNSVGESALTNSLNAISLSNAPTNLIITQQADGFKLDWNDNSSIETSFKIQRKINGGSWSNLTTTTNTTYTDLITINKNQVYEYQVCAINVNGDSSYVTWGIEVVDSVTLSAVLDDVGNKITYSWGSNTVADGYKLYITDINNNTVMHDLTTTNYVYNFTTEVKNNAYIVAYDNITYGTMNSVNSNTVNTINSPREIVTDITHTFDISNGLKLVGSFKDKSKIENGFKVKYNLDGAGWLYVDIPSTTTDLIDTIYNFEIQLGSNPQNLIYSIAPYNAIGVGIYSSEINISKTIDFIQSAYLSDNNVAKIGWYDNSTDETDFKVIYSIDNGISQIRNVISTTTSAKGNTYTDSISLGVSSVINAIVCPLQNGILGLPSDIATTSFATYIKQVAPTNFIAEWVSDGIAEFSWNDNSIKETGFKFVYTINSGEEQIIDIPSTTLLQTGAKYSKQITLNNLDTISAKAYSYNLVDTSEQTTVQEMTYIQFDPVPPSLFWREKVENGVKLNWNPCDFVINYEVHYLIDNISHISTTTDTSYTIVLDYSTMQSFEAYVIVNYNGGMSSIPTNTVIFSLTQVKFIEETYVKNTQIVQSDINTVVLNKRLVQKYDNLLTIYNANVKTEITGFITYFVNYAVKSLNLLNTNIYNKLNQSYNKDTVIYNKTKYETELVDLVYVVGLETKFPLETKSIDKAVRLILSNSMTIKNNGVSTYFTNCIFVSNLNITQEYLLNTASYSQTLYMSEAIRSTIYTKCKIENYVETIIQKITIVCIGDSITAGHPNYWVESGTGNPESQYEYWLQKRLGNEFDVINKGYGSDTTLRMLNRFERDIVAYHPNYVVIQGGTNDLYWAMSESNNNVDYLKMKMGLAQDNLITMINRTLEIGAVPIVGTLIPRTTATGIYRQGLWDYNAWIINYCMGRDDVYYADFYNAGKENVPPTPLEEPTVAGNLNPLYDGDSTFDIYGNLQRRGYGVHPSILGYKIMSEAVSSNIFKSLLSGIKLYIDADCTIEEDTHIVNKTEQVYDMTINNLNRGKTKYTARYIKNIGNKPIAYSLYTTKINGFAIQFSINDGEYKDNINGKLDSNSIAKINIKIDVPRLGDAVDVALSLDTRAFVNNIS